MKIIIFKLFVLFKKIINSDLNNSNVTIANNFCSLLKFIKENFIPMFHFTLACTPVSLFLLIGKINNSTSLAR